MDIDLEEDYVSWHTVYKSESVPVAQQAIDTPTEATVTYRDVGVQSLPDSNADAFQTIYNREPTQDELVSKTCVAAIDHYTAGVGSGPYETIVGMPFLAPMSVETGETYTDASFQTLGNTECKISIVRAKGKASILVAEKRPVAREAGYKIWCEKQDDLVVHTEQYPIRIRIDDDGNVTDTDAHGVMLPNVCGEVIDSDAAAVSSWENEGPEVWSRTLPRDRIFEETFPHPNRISSLDPSSPMEICQPWVPQQFVKMDIDEPKTPPVSLRYRWDQYPTPTIPPPKRYVAPQRPAPAHCLAGSHTTHQDLTSAQYPIDPMDIDPAHGASNFTYNSTRNHEPPHPHLSPSRTSAPHPSTPNHSRTRNRISVQASDFLPRAPANPDTSFPDFVAKTRRDRAAHIDEPARDDSGPLNYDEEGSEAWREAQNIDVYASARAAENVRREAVSQQRDEYYGVN